jgi:hypothetical protein
MLVMNTLFRCRDSVRMDPNDLGISRISCHRKPSWRRHMGPLTRDKRAPRRFGPRSPTMIARLSANGGQGEMSGRLNLVPSRSRGAWVFRGVQRSDCLCRQLQCRAVQLPPIGAVPAWTQKVVQTVARVLRPDGKHGRARQCSRCRVVLANRPGPNVSPWATWE